GTGWSSLPADKKASARRRGCVPQDSARESDRMPYFASNGSTITNLPICPLFRNLMRPVTLAKSVSSLPRPTFSPGFTRVPRCRMMIVPPGTTCPPNALNPSRCEFESRPFREVPCPFLCAIEIQLSVASCQLLSLGTGAAPVVPYHLPIISSSRAISSPLPLGQPFSWRPVSPPSLR